MPGRHVFRALPRCYDHHVESIDEKGVRNHGQHQYRTLDRRRLGRRCYPVLSSIFVLNGIILAEQWAQAMTDLGRPALAETTGELVTFLIYDLVMGLAALWIYVGIRPRFGPGTTTAIYAGLATWLLAIALPNAFVLTIGLFPATLLWTVIIVGIVQLVVPTVVGAYLYRETA